MLASVILDCLKIRPNFLPKICTLFTHQTHLTLYTDVTQHLGNDFAKDFPNFCTTLLDFFLILSNAAITHYPFCFTLAERF